MKIPVKSDSTHASLKGAFTVVELVVIIAMVAILAATLLPAIASTKMSSRRAACANNLKQIGLATFSYTSDSDNYMPPLKWNGNNNDTYPYELFRYTPVNVTPPTYDVSGGPYNLGLLWPSKILTDGHTFYCPAREERADNRTYQFYNTSVGNWPFGGGPTASNPGYVRTGYYYYPQSRNAKVNNTTDAPVANPIIPFWPPSTDPSNIEPLKTWVCVPLFKLSDVDLGKSMVTDDLLLSLNNITHQENGRPAGSNAVFADGHVYWQSVAKNRNAFDPTLWALISSGSASFGNDITYVLSALKR